MATPSVDVTGEEDVVSMMSMEQSSGRRKETTRVLLLRTIRDVYLLREMIDKPGVQYRIELRWAHKELRKRVASEFVDVVMLDLDYLMLRACKRSRGTLNCTSHTLIVLTGLMMKYWAHKPEGAPRTIW